jgi:transketolase-like protein
MRIALRLTERPSAITDDSVARSGGVAGIAHAKPSSFQVATIGFNNKAGDRQVTTRLRRAQTRPITFFYGSSRCRVETLRNLIAVIVGQIGTDDEQCFRPKTICRNGSSTSSACSGASNRWLPLSNPISCNAKKPRPRRETFFIFSDYARPAIRLSALMELPTIFVFTHDAMGDGEDGPTHQPVEQLASFRAEPGLVVLRDLPSSSLATSVTHSGSNLYLRNNSLRGADASQACPEAGRRRSQQRLPSD